MSKPCICIESIPYRTADGEVKEVLKGRKFTFLRYIGGNDKSLLRYGNKLFIVDTDKVKFV